MTMTDPTLPPRTGPRPLALHLACATMIWLTSSAALPIARHGSMPWKPELEKAARALAPALESAAPDALHAALVAEAGGRIEAMLAGVEAYRAHPYRRALDEPPLLWSEGSSRLYDYGAFADAGASARPVLFVPSLVNRGYVLDLSARRSLLRHLAAAGLRPMLLEWGAPGEAERGFSFTDYVTRRLEGALDAALAATGGPLGLAGYCMGGQLALALALRRPDAIERVALLATPWDYHANPSAQVQALAAAAGPLALVIESAGELPVDWIQCLIAGLDPALVPTKFRAFAAVDPASPAAENFVALEDWVNDGIALAGPVAREFLFGWYVENKPARGRWLIDDAPVEPARLDRPTLLVLPEQDRIVPPSGAKALADAIPGATVHSVPFGHIGMVVSSKAQGAVWSLLADWFAPLRPARPPRRKKPPTKA